MNADAVIAENWPLARYLARQACRGRDDEDVVATAALGLWDAAANFREDRGARFATYATHCIRNRIRNHFVRLRRQDKRNRMDPREAVQTTGNRSLELTEATEEAQRLLAVLTPVQREIVERIFYGGERQRAIGKSFGRSHAWVYIHYRDALAAMRKAMT